MRVAVISDLHGNLISLETVLADLERDRPDRIVCLGDVATAGSHPHETIERLRVLDCPTVMGNADDELLHVPPQTRPDEDGQRVMETIRWGTDHLSPADLEYLRGFPPTLELSLDHGRKLLCFHGSPRSFDDVISATTPEADLDCMLSGHDASVMAGGHTHEQLVRHHRETTVLNPGSVGLSPPRAEYAVIESTEERLCIELRQVALPVEEIRHAILDSGMPHAEWWASFWE